MDFAISCPGHPGIANHRVPDFSARKGLTTDFGGAGYSDSNFAYLDLCTVYRYSLNEGGYFNDETLDPGGVVMQTDSIYDKHEDTLYASYVYTLSGALKKPKDYKNFLVELYKDLRDSLKYLGKEAKEALLGLLWPILGPLAEFKDFLVDMASNIIQSAIDAILDSLSKIPGFDAAAVAALLAALSAGVIKELVEFVEAAVRDPTEIISFIGDNLIGKIPGLTPEQRDSLKDGLDTLIGLQDPGRLLDKLVDLLDRAMPKLVGNIGLA